MKRLFFSFDAERLADVEDLLGQRTDEGLRALVDTARRRSYHTVAFPEEVWQTIRFELSSNQLEFRELGDQMILSPGVAGNLGKALASLQLYLPDEYTLLAAIFALVKEQGLFLLSLKE